MKRREPTDEERALWDAHTGGDKKLRRPNKQKKPVIPPPANAGIRVDRGNKEAAPAAGNPLRERRQAEKKADDLRAGDMRHMDSRTAQRLRKGAAPIDAALDLHGMTRENAWTAFQSFVLRQHEGGRRRLLVITGKGPQGKGVLRESMDHWVNDPSVRSLILGYDKAQGKHGGGGAFYLLLRKHRAG